MYNNAKRFAEDYPHIIQEYRKPHFWNLYRKHLLRRLDRNGISYHLVNRQGVVVGGSR